MAGGKRIGSLHEPVVLVMPGGEGGGPETETAPTIPVDEMRPQQGISPIALIFGALLLIVVGMFGLGKLLK